ncbi:MAG: GAF domain-containing protein, partial [Chloroflexota bacterium]
MGTALENARLLDETTQQNAELAVINSVQEALAAQLDIRGIYEVVGDKVREIFDAQAIILVSYDQNAKTNELHYMYEKGERFFPEPAISSYGGMTSHFINDPKPLMFNENTSEEIAKLGGIVPAGEKSKSAIFVPLRIRNQTSGMITIQNIDRENAFTESDMRLLITLGRSMSVALESARLFDETTQKNAELAVINSVQEALAAEQDIEGIYEAVGEKIKEIFDAQVVQIIQYDHSENRQYLHYFIEKGERFYLDPEEISPLQKHIIKTRVTITAQNNAYGELKKLGATIQAGEAPKSYVSVPIIRGREVTGAISIQNIDRENAFSDSDIRLIKTLANSMSVAVENAHLFNQTNQRNAEL